MESPETPEPFDPMLELVRIVVGSFVALVCVIGFWHVASAAHQESVEYNRRVEQLEIEQFARHLKMVLEAHCRLQQEEAAKR